MKNPQITSVITFCSNDYRMLNACIAGVRPFSQKIIIAVCDHFFDGSEENYALLEHVYCMYPDCLFIEYAFDPMQSYRRFSPHYPEHENWRHEWANTNRWISYYFLPSQTEFIFFLDADEIVDPQSFISWLDANDLNDYSVLSFSAYWYFRQACYRAKNYDDISLLVRKSALTPDHLWHPDERTGILLNINGKKRYHIVGLDGKPLVHHYSWVRTKQELCKKFTTWSHHRERDWLKLTEIEFAAPFEGRDFIRGYTYDTVVSSFDPLEQQVPELAAVSRQEHLFHLKEMGNVIRVDRKEMEKKEIMALL